jgi:hypothetical protein
MIQVVVDIVSTTTETATEIVAIANVKLAGVVTLIAIETANVTEIGNAHATEIVTGIGAEVVVPNGMVEMIDMVMIGMVVVGVGNLMVTEMDTVVAQATMGEQDATSVPGITIGDVMVAEMKDIVVGLEVSGGADQGVTIAGIRKGAMIGETTGEWMIGVATIDEMTEGNTIDMANMGKGLHHQGGEIDGNDQKGAIEIVIETGIDLVNVSVMNVIANLHIIMTVTVTVSVRSAKTKGIVL